MATETNNIHYTGRVSDLGDELGVMLAHSDWGEKGWMVVEEVRVPGRRVIVTPKLFFAGTDKVTFEKAKNAALTETFMGYN